MKYNVGIIGLLLLCTTLFQNCAKNDDSTPDLISIEEYITQNNISPEYTSSGLGYIINTAGDDRRADDQSTVKAIVVVKTTDNTTQIDTETDILLNLLSQVDALMEGLQLIGSGGNITIYAPSELAWGTDGNTSVAGSSDLIIDVQLTEILLDVEEYIEENSITTTDTTASGVYVVIEEEGDGTFPDENSSVTVSYSGYFSTGDIFDANDEGLQIALADVIQGWQEGIPKFSKGGKGKLFIPYEAAYGEVGSGSIPGYTDIIFDIELIDFQ